MDVEAMFADMGAFWEFRTYSTLGVVSIPNVQSSLTPNTDGWDLKRESSHSLPQLSQMQSGTCLPKPEESPYGN
jgi:hypothetical protein